MNSAKDALPLDTIAKMSVARAHTSTLYICVCVCVSKDESRNTRAEEDPGEMRYCNIERRDRGPVAGALGPKSARSTNATTWRCTAECRRRTRERRA